MSIATASSPPWYRDRWPWILISGPAIVVVACIFTTVLAVVSNDGLVTEDYYKQGLAINRLLAREDMARSLGLQAVVQFSPGHDRVRVRLEGAQAPGGVPALVLIHATRAGEDQSVALREVAAGTYEGMLHPPGAGVWRLQLQDARATWRLTGHWRAGQGGATLGAGTR
jgi:hypothetical protein